jgi:DNA-binding GntR family transcriptional regulator
MPRKLSEKARPVRRQSPTATAKAEPHRPRRIAWEIASELRSRIQKGQLRPGEWLREVRLADELSAGRAAVREALRLLERDGLVELERFRGARVTTPTLYEMFDLFEVRAALFGLVVRFACFRARDEELAEIAEKIEHLVANAKRTTPEDRINEGIEIVTMISRHANRHATEMMAASQRKARWHFSYLDFSERSHRPLDYWAELAVRLRGRDADGAADAARRIIHYVQSEVVKTLAARGARSN